ncbi:hypothetical protein HanXRQr2_Chr01g0015421 [Helianthus annuus]|uniref:Uncharacterized protein n=1 Tax=Helianthus annuus TaxID=4232 RepID=A0A9K3P1S7_HELAN|nr:hypothetical protein HanXRQr2_Chr01g0015421 [Helianthus annuus]KAJ0956443.1 hypothetical protein HanPSC8_Chr01g0014891 [Helianthus annuus]
MFEHSVLVFNTLEHVHVAFVRYLHANSSGPFIFPMASFCALDTSLSLFIILSSPM